MTDWNGSRYLASQPRLDEVDCWQPGGSRALTALATGELFLFKLKSPRNVIAGGGVFVHSTLLPLNLAWETFTIGNGAASRAEMKRLIDSHRRGRHGEDANYTIGCILLAEPFFLPPERWIPVPSDWKPNIVQGKIYDLTREPGLSLYVQLKEALEQLAAADRAWPQLAADLPSDPRDRYGAPVLVRPRLGRGLFRRW